MTRTSAEALLHEMIENPKLRRHCQTVAWVMEAYAKKMGEDADEWYITGLLHDADYEKYPEQHPAIIVQQLQEAGLEKIAYAVSGHYTKWGVEPKSLLDKAIIACDELTGFIIACAQIRPTKLEGLSVKSVKKRFKSPKFAAGVEREEVRKGMELFGVEMEEHVAFIIETLQAHQEELNL